MLFTLTHKKKVGGHRVLGAGLQQPRRSPVPPPTEDALQPVAQEATADLEPQTNEN